jgi:hypothetical protein
MSPFLSHILEVLINSDLAARAELHIMGSAPDATKHKFDSRICDRGIPPSPKLCKKCQQLFEEWHLEPDIFPYWENVAIFEAAAAEGRQLCNMFLTQMPASFLDEARWALERNESSAKPLTISKWYQPVSEGYWSLFLGFTFTLSEDPPQERHAKDVLVNMSPLLTPGMFFRR